MEPRESRIKRQRKDNRKKIFKALTSSLALSSSVVLGAQLTSPTYAHFNSELEETTAIEACFIFPKTIEEEYVGKSEELYNEILSEMEQIQAQKSAIDTTSFDSALANLMVSSESSSNAGSSGSSFGGGGGSISELESAISSIQSEISSLESQITVAEDNLTAINSLNLQLTDLLNQQQEFKDFIQEAQTNTQEKSEEIKSLLDELAGFKERAVEECTYEEEYFEEQIEKIESFLSESEILVTQIAEEQTEADTKINSFNDTAAQLGKMSSGIEAGISSMKSSIISLESQISSIQQQIQALREQEAKEQAEREAREQAELEAKEMAEKEAAEKAELEAKEKAAKEAEEVEEKETKEAESIGKAEGQPDQSQSKEVNTEESLSGENATDQ